MRKPGPKPAITRRDLVFVREQIEAGKSYVEIASHFGVTDRTVSCFARRNGIGRKRGRPLAWPDCPDHLRDQFRRLRKNYGYNATQARVILEAASPGAKRMGGNGPITCTQAESLPVYGCRPFEGVAA